MKSVSSIQAARSRAEEFRDVDFDLVVTLCDEAEENCPAWLGRGKRAHRCIFDPTISNDMNNFRQVRDDIEREII